MMDVPGWVVGSRIDRDVPPRLLSKIYRQTRFYRFYRPFFGTNPLLLADFSDKSRFYRASAHNSTRFQGIFGEKTRPYRRHIPIRRYRGVSPQAGKIQQMTLLLFLNLYFYITSIYPPTHTSKYQITSSYRWKEYENDIEQCYTNQRK